MTRCVAFLRAINVGGHTVKMDVLRAQFETLGFGSVSSFIASGNVIFEADSDDAAAIEQRIEAMLLNSFGYPVAALVRFVADLAAIGGHAPFPAADLEAEGSSLHVVFQREPPARMCAKLFWPSGAHWTTFTCTVAKSTGSAGAE